MPIATSTILLAGAIGAGIAYLATRDDGAGDENSPEGDGPEGAELDEDYLIEDEGDLIIDADEIIVPKRATLLLPSQAGYPWQTNPPPGTGYNQEQFPDSLAVRTALRFLLYDVYTHVMGVAIDTPPPASEVKRFQRNYNQASERGYREAKGYLKEDGIAGAKTLRALSRAVYGTDGGTLDDSVRGAAWATEFDLW